MLFFLLGCKSSSEKASSIHNKLSDPMEKLLVFERDLYEWMQSVKIGILKEFLFLADELNFSRTAKHFYVNQSVMSKHIVELEKELGIQLFLRDKHSVRLTSTGKVFVDCARKIVDAYDEAIRTVESTKKQKDSFLRVGYLFGASRKFLPYTCRLFRERCPNTQLELFSFEAGRIKEALKANAIDLAITLHFRGQESDVYQVDRIVEDSFAVVVPLSHRLAGNSSVSVADLESEVLLAANPQTMPELSEFLRRQLRSTGLLERIDHQLNDVNSLTILMNTNLELALSLMHLDGFYGPYFKFIPLEGVDLSCDLAAIWKKSKEKESIVRFVECIHKSIDALSILEKAL